MVLISSGKGRESYTAKQTDYNFYFLNEVLMPGRDKMPCLIGYVALQRLSVSELILPELYSKTY